MYGAYQIDTSYYCSSGRSDHSYHRHSVHMSLLQEIQTKKAILINLGSDGYVYLKDWRTEQSYIWLSRYKWMEFY